MSETLEQFMARKHDPKWRAPRVPKPRFALPRTKGAALGRLIEEFNVIGFGTEAPAREATPEGETVEQFMARKHDPNWKPATLAKLFAAGPNVRVKRWNEREFRAQLAAYNQMYAKKAA